MTDIEPGYIVEQQKRIRDEMRALRDEQVLTRRRFDSLDDKLTLLADQLEIVAQHVVQGFVDIQRQLAETDAEYGRKIIGAMKNTIDDHGPITKDLIGSVMKRFRGLNTQ